MVNKATRLSAYALALLTSFALFAQQTAVAAQPGPRVEGAGWFCTPDFAAGATGCAEIKFGITANVTGNGAPQGRFDYFNRFTGYSVHGVIVGFTQNPATCGNAGAPAAQLHGSCTDGASCDFWISVVDDGPGQQDWACDIQMTGTDKQGRAEVRSDHDQPLQRGNIQVKSTP